MAEQPRSASQRKSPASKTAASNSTPRRATKATGKASTTKATGKASTTKATGKPSSGSAGGGRRSSRRAKTSGREAVLQAREQVSELTGRPVESVLGMERDDDGWLITVQMVELARIPSSTDVLGDYAVRVDDDGEVIGYRRTRRYHRGQADEG